MRVLLDECLPRKLKSELSGHEVKTVSEMGWASKKNSALLALAAGHFDVFLTVDQNIAYQQNPKDLPLAIVALVAGSNRLVDLRPLVPKVLEVLRSVKPGEIFGWGPNNRLKLTAHGRSELASLRRTRAAA